jgi:hypothetical protein
LALAPCLVHRRQRDARRKSGHSEHGPDKEVPHAHERGQPTEARFAWPANGLVVGHSIGTKDGSIIATIITIHMPRNNVAAAVHVCPGIGIFPIADMGAHQTVVSAALTAKSSAETLKNACWEPRSETMRRDLPFRSGATTITT